LIFFTAFLLRFLNEKSKLYLQNFLIILVVIFTKNGVFETEYSGQSRSRKLKECRKYSTNPDVTNYPFALAFSAKDSCEQRENGLKEAKSLVSNDKTY